jgi:hypothetical protein
MSMSIASNHQFLLYPELSPDSVTVIRSDLLGLRPSTLVNVCIANCRFLALLLLF